MTCDLEPTSPGRVFRLARKPDPWAYPDWSYAGDDGTFGNRWDDPEGSYRVLYASSQRLGAFVETLSRFRPDPAVVAGLAEIVDDEPDTVAVLPPGHVPRSWFDTRAIGEGTLRGSYADVGHSRSLSHLRAALAPRVVHYGLDDLDAGTIRVTAPRRFTQDVSRYVYRCTQPQGQRQFAGIHYLSRLGDDFENWATFEPRQPTDPQVAPIHPDDPDLVAALQRLGLILSPQ